MKNDKRGMRRREFHGITRARLVHRHFRTDGFSGETGLLYIFEVERPWIVRDTKENSVVIADAGYEWLQLSPDESGWWLTAMFDGEGNLKQYYFDITMENFVSGEGEPGFTDLYLDIVMEPDGKWSLLDRDELDEALACGDITPSEHSLAKKRAKELIARVDGNEKWWRSLCARARDELKVR